MGPELPADPHTPTGPSGPAASLATTSASPSRQAWAGLSLILTSLCSGWVEIALNASRSVPVPACRKRWVEVAVRMNRHRRGR